MHGNEKTRALFIMLLLGKPFLLATLQDPLYMKALGVLVKTESDRRR